ncbi:hypothetical protein E2C01_086767 [Portunus trituberculatus]|uniref:Uncharacterized protein n=1 Tax=Portunus trituberculatus TaxID=210409 RepID=A0A5B7J1Q3_PORTR|nr:hypothetical protein [Portunus trituberculatus]
MAAVGRWGCGAVRRGDIVWDCYQVGGVWLGVRRGEEGGEWEAERRPVCDFGRWGGREML